MMRSPGRSPKRCVAGHEVAERAAGIDVPGHRVEDEGRGR